AYLDTALAAASSALDAPSARLTNVSFTRALVVPEVGSRILRLAIRRRSPDVASFEFASRAIDINIDRSSSAADESAWTAHAAGQIDLDETASTFDRVSLDEIKARCSEVVSADAYYQALDALGVRLGQTFQCLGRIWRRDGEALAEMRVS